MTARMVELPLARDFYERDTPTIARALLGRRLVRMLPDGQRLSGLICETEAYGGPDDQASHAYRRTPRSAIMYGPPGVAYVYLIYGLHYCLNAVTECDGRPGAVLIRGILPREGVEIMRGRRPGVEDRHLADGPGKVCQTMGITLAENGVDLTAGHDLFITAGELVNEERLVITKRIGVRGDDETRERLWRFVLRLTSAARPSVA